MNIIIDNIGISNGNVMGGPDFDWPYLANSTLVIHELTLTASSSQSHQVKSRQYGASLSPTSSLWLPRCGTNNFYGAITKDPDKAQEIFQN